MHRLWQILIINNFRVGNNSADWPADIGDQQPLGFSFFHRDLESDTNMFASGKINLQMGTKIELQCPGKYLRKQILGVRQGEFL